MTSPWWQDAVFYQIYPRSFCDTTGNGVGDLVGIRRKLDSLVELGVDALWLSPIYPSPMADHGYDVADYCDVDPLFGSLDDLDQLVADAHDRDLRVVLDWVPCHTSEAHPWFVEARCSRDSPKRDWYIFWEGSPEVPPNDWRSTFPMGKALPGSAWTWDEISGAWYYHRFTPQQPDLNWANADLREAMHDTLRFWFDRGVDGFRIDVVQHLGKDPSLVTVDGHGSIFGDQPGPTDPQRSHEYIRELRRVFDSNRDGPKLAVGEVYVLDVQGAASFVGRGPQGDELHLGFNFLPLFLPWKAAEWRAHLALVEEAYGARQAWPTWAFGSHDIARQRTRLGSGARARAMAVLLLGLRGTPFLYAGEELGLEDAHVPPEQAQDPAGFRDGCRAPIPWDDGPGFGWAVDEAWLPWPPDAANLNAATQRQDPDSVLSLYRRLLAARRASPALRQGEQALSRHESAIESDVVAWERRAGADVRWVAVNFSDESRRFVPATGEGWVVAVASDGLGEGAPYQGELAPSQAVILEPAASATG
jgi:alpha-glucosidase